MKILILGAGKSGTTALTYCIHKQLKDYKVIFEPHRLSDIDYSKDNLIVKFLNIFRFKQKDLSHFDRKILMVRHPFDRLISFLLYIPYSLKRKEFFQDDLTSRYIDILELKTNYPDRITIIEIFETLNSILHIDALESISREYVHILDIHNKSNLEIIKYENFVTRKIENLNKYLGLKLNTEVEVPDKYRRVERTKGHSDWKNWLTESDIQALSSAFEEFNRVFSYSTKRESNWVKLIAPEHSYLYTIKVINEARRKCKISDYQHRQIYTKEKQMPQVSVVLPAYQGDRYIFRALESVLNQTFTDWEMIVVDDGSTDNTRLRLQPYWEKIRYVYQENQGVAAARNHGISLSQGKWIAFLDQDDEFLPDKLETQVSCFKKQPNLGLVHSGWHIVDSQGKILGDVTPWQGIPELTLANWVRWKPVFLGGILFDRQWLCQVGGFDAGLQQTSDVDLVLRLAAIGCPATWVRQRTVCYRQHDRNVSRNAREQAKEMEVVLDRFFRRPHLSEEIYQLEAPARYQSLVWSAVRLYAGGDVTGMVRVLEESLQYTSYGLSETILDWVKWLRRYGAEYGWKLEMDALTNLPAWQQLMVTTRSFFSLPLKIDGTRSPDKYASI